jgi:transglutaminase-like putative cysteine protease
MRLKLFAALVIILFMVPAFSGCTWFSGDEDETGTSFKPAELAAPEVPSYLPYEEVDLPAENESQLPPGFSYNISWAMGTVYADWGSFNRITLKNTGANDIFIYRAGIEVNWSFPPQWFIEDRRVPIPQFEEKDLGLVYFDAPKVEGEFEYRILISLLVKDNELFDTYGIESWYDNGTVKGKVRELTVVALESAKETKVEHNLKFYQDKLKKRVDFEDPQITGTASDLIEDYPGDYNIYQVLAIFSYMVDDLTYISDPDGRDYWAVCTETLDREGGDCEDFSILFSSFIGAIGGNTRIYLTKTHAFPALYVGDSAQKNEILDAIRLYYGTEPRFVIYQEDGEFWLVADPAGTLYMGGLPADSQPAYISEDPLSLGFNFDETEKIHAIDIKE